MRGSGVKGERELLRDDSTLRISLKREFSTVTISDIDIRTSLKYMLLRHQHQSL